MRRNIITLLFLCLSLSFLFPKTTHAQFSKPPYCPTIRIWIEEKDAAGNVTREIDAPALFPDNDIRTIHYDITLDPATISIGKTYNVFTDKGEFYLDGVDFGFNGTNFNQPTQDPDGTYHLRKDIEDRRDKMTRSFWQGKHQFNLENENRTKLCSVEYEVVPGLSQKPIICTLNPVSSYPGPPPNPAYMSAINDITVSVDFAPESKINPDGLYPGLRAMDKQLYSFNLNTNEKKLIRSWNDFNYINDFKYEVLIPSNTLLIGNWQLIAEFYYGIGLPKAGECSSMPFTICAAGTNDPSCLYPSVTPTPSPTPTETLQCKNCTIDMCKKPGCADCWKCQPTYTPIPPMPNLKPLCDNINPQFRTNCNACINKGNHIWTAVGCVPIDPSVFLKSYILTYGIGIAGGCAFLYFLYGSFLLLTSAGNAEQVGEGRQILTSAISGILLVIFSVLFLRIVGVDLLRIPGFG